MKTNPLAVMCMLALAAVVKPMGCYGMAKKPTLLVLPSDNWCSERYFLKEFDSHGETQYYPDYERAFFEDREIGVALSEIGSMMLELGFPVKDANRELKAISKRKTEDGVTYSENYEAVSTSPRDLLLLQTKADIVLEVSWFYEMSNKTLSVTLDAFDSYTSKMIATTTGVTKSEQNGFGAQVLINALKSQKKKFSKQLQEHFEIAEEVGREIVLFVRVWEGANINFETEFGGLELTDIIANWILMNAVGGMYSLTDATETRLFFEQIMMPSFTEEDYPQDARRFFNPLKQHLENEPYSLSVKLQTKGLGEAQLIIE